MASIFTLSSKVTMRTLDTSLPYRFLMIESWVQTDDETIKSLNPSHNTKKIIR